MKKAHTIIITMVTAIALIAISSGITVYIINNNQLATITSVTPYMVTYVIPYQECYDKRHTTYTKPGDSANVIGGVAGGATGAVVTYALTTNPVVLAGGAIAGVFGGQAIERHVNKPKASTRIEEKCVVKHKNKQVQRGYLVNFTYKHKAEKRVVTTKPLDNKMPISMLETAPTPEDVVTQLQKEKSNIDN